jgi:hypothetical protein
MLYVQALAACSNSLSPYDPSQSYNDTRFFIIDYQFYLCNSVSKTMSTIMIYHNRYILEGCRQRAATERLPMTMNERYACIHQLSYSFDYIV